MNGLGRKTKEIDKNAEIIGAFLLRVTQTHAEVWEIAMTKKSVKVDG